MRPKFVLFGSSIVQHSYYQGWGATLTHLYARKVLFLPLIIDSPIPFRNKRV